MLSLMMSLRKRLSSRLQDEKKTHEKKLRKFALEKMSSRGTDKCCHFSCKDEQVHKQAQHFDAVTAAWFPLLVTFFVQNLGSALCSQ